MCCFWLCVSVWAYKCSEQEGGCVINSWRLCGVSTAPWRASLLCWLSEVPWAWMDARFVRGVYNSNEGFAEVSQNFAWLTKMSDVCTGKDTTLCDRYMYMCSVVRESGVWSARCPQLVFNWWLVWMVTSEIQAVDILTHIHRLPHSRRVSSHILFWNSLIPCWDRPAASRVPRKLPRLSGTVCIRTYTNCFSGYFTSLPWHVTFSVFLFQQAL